MKIDIVPVDGKAVTKRGLSKEDTSSVYTPRPNDDAGSSLNFVSTCSTPSKRTIEANSNPINVEAFQITAVTTTVTLEEIFTKFLELEVGDGAASADTIRNYLSQTKQYLNWCRDNLLPPLEADVEDIKLYRQYIVQSGYQNSTIATKLNIVRIFYKAALTHGLIKSNPVRNIKAPKDRKDPAARITFMEAEELKFLLDHIQSQLDEAKTNKQKLVLLRDRALIGIMSLEGCRTV